MTDAYVLGDTAAERERLHRQGDLFADESGFLLTRAGITRGMSVLEVGCGVGDLTALLVDIVGPRGRVVAVDRDPRALDVARRRPGLGAVEFVEATLPDVPDVGPVDAATGRFVLPYVADPALAVRRAAEQVRPGGLVTFQDAVASAARAVPAVELVDRSIERAIAAMRAGGADPDVGQRLHAVFRRAGLPRPRISSCQPGAGDPASPLFDVFAAGLASLLPAMVRHGIATEEEVDVGSLADRIREATVARDAVLYMQTVVAAWCRLSA